MTIFQSLILGAVQGLGEFLPISSTAHLVLIPYFFSWPDPGLAFDVALHVGTLIAVVAFFWKDWLEIFSSAFRSYKAAGLGGLKNELFFYLIIATIPGALFGFLLEEKAETVFRSPLLIALALIFMGAVLYWADKYFQGKRKTENVNFIDSIIIGLSQALAVIPGFSRSGVTITAGLFRGLDRVKAARFSFLLSTPIIFGAAVLKLPQLIASGLDLAIISGIISSAVFGFLAIKYLLKFLNKYGFAIFFWYRLALGLGIILFYYLNI